MVSPGPAASIIKLMIEVPGAVVFPNLTELPAGAAAPDDAARDALLAVALPATDADCDVALQAAGIKRAKRSTARLKVAVLQDDKRAGQKRRREWQPRKLTNTHLADLFKRDGDGGGSGAHNAIDR